MKEKKPAPPPKKKIRKRLEKKLRMEETRHGRKTGWVDPVHVLVYKYMHI